MILNAPQLVEIYSLNESNRVLQRLKRSEIRGAAVLQVAGQMDR